jgi:hypothetical protein
MHVKNKKKFIASLKVVQHGSVPLIRLLPISFKESELKKVLSIINGLLSSIHVGTSGVKLPQSVAKNVS